MTGSRRDKERSTKPGPRYPWPALLAVLVTLGLLAVPVRPGPVWASSAQTPFPPPGQVPAAVLTKGSPGTFEALFVDKSLQRMFIFRYADEGPPELIKILPVSTGRREGGKLSAGDRRTPEGVYFFTQSHRDRRLTIFGRRAYKMNYPDPFDKLEGRRGNGIYLHGTNRPLGSRDTNGCVVMKNSDLEWLAGLLKLRETPIIIASSLNWISSREYLRRRDELAGPPQAVLTAANCDLEQTGARQGAVMVDLGSRHLFRIPDFDQDLGRGWRTVYVTGEDLKPRVVASVWHPGRAGGEKLSSKSPVRLQGEGVYDFLQAWVTAWESRQVEDYLAFYHPRFRGYGMNLAHWRVYKAGLAAKYREIDVKIEDIKVVTGGSRTKVVFKQTYYSDQYQDYGRKTLILVKSAGSWKILRESWRPLKNKNRGQG